MGRFSRSAELAEKLIAAGANVNAADEYGETPLTLACANGDVPLVESLLKAGADPKVARWNGETALMIAAGAGSVEEVKLLLDHGADVNAAESAQGPECADVGGGRRPPGCGRSADQQRRGCEGRFEERFTPLVFAASQERR